tara:strand:- start:406 stop:1107 length:702 start_codon:yes stop_codon:yes gene_type:complete
MNKLSVVIPVLNEEQNLRKLVEEIFSCLVNKYIFEIIFVNDGSTDRSIEVLEEIKNKYNNIYIINQVTNKGQSFSIFNGVRLSNYKSIVTLDADLQNDPKDIEFLAKFYFQNYPNFKLVGGIRNKRKDSIIKLISSKIANKVRKFILNDKCDDTGCSLKIFDKDEFLKLPYFSGMHRFLPALFLALNNQNFFLKVNHRHRIHGKSKYGTIDRLIKGIIDIFRVLIIKNKLNND